MAYSLRHSDKSVEHGVKRIADSQLKTGLAELEDNSLSDEEKVHQARKRCKKMRGLVRLVRGSLDSYREENETYRDAARTLSGTRDTAASLEALDALEARYAEELKVAALSPLRKALEEDHVDLDRAHVEDCLAGMRVTFREGLARSEDWTLADKGAEAFSAGTSKTYKRARKAMRAARKHDTAQRFHEWRKRVKYHWYHTRLMKRVWPEVMKGYAKEAKQLADLLGDHHDLAVLKDRAPDLLDSDHGDTLELFEALASTRQRELAEEAFVIGGKLFAEETECFSKRWSCWWRVWTG